MKKLHLLIATLTTALLIGCGTTSKVPVTGRKQSLLVNNEQVLSLSEQQYKEYMKTAKASTNAKQTAMVKRVGQRLAAAVVEYLNANGMGDEVKTYTWEFNLVQDNTANAFCMPGGKIVVYEGLLPVTQSESALAIVLGHEIAHAVAKHSAEQLSTKVKQQMGAKVLGAVLGATGVNNTTSILTQTAFSLGTKLGSLKYSRNNESEADYMGLIFAAMAGYDPSVAVSFWQRMAASSTSSMPAFLSDHPSDSKRIANINKWLPTAQKYYRPVTTTTTKKSSTKKTSTKKTSTKKSTTKKSSAKKSTAKKTTRKK